MKAVLANRIFMEADAALQASIQRTLTYSIPPKYGGQVMPEIIKTYGKASQKVITLPAGRTDLIPEGYQIIDNRVSNPIEWPSSVGLTLRGSQQEVYDNCTGSCIINAPVSWGKTFTGLKIAEKFGLKTLVVTHTTILRDQWISEVKNMYKITPGVIGGGRTDNLDSPIVIGNVQTLVKKTAMLERAYGTLILDEMHHVPATTFKTIVDKSHATNKIGLSGTVIRKDGHHVIFQDYFGSKIFKPPAENFIKPTVYVVKTNIEFGNSKSPYKESTWAVYSTLLSQDLRWRDLIINLALRMVKEGHKVLVVSDRVEFLEFCHHQTKEVSTIVTAAVKDREYRHELIRTGAKKVLFGSINIYSEGISLNELSCLIVACQINNDSLLTQLIGRVTRKMDNKITPVIVDVHLAGRMVRPQISNRMSLYFENGYTIKQGSVTF